MAENTYAPRRVQRFVRKLALKIARLQETRRGKESIVTHLERQTFQYTTHCCNINISPISRGDRHAVDFLVALDPNSLHLACGLTRSIGSNNNHVAAIRAVRTESDDQKSLVALRNRSVAEKKFVYLRINVVTQGRKHPFNCFMDTGAGVNIICERTARELQLPYQNTVVPKELVAFGGEKYPAVGYVGVQLETFCNAAVPIEAYFYVVDDKAMLDSNEAYLSLGLIRELNHIVRRPCTPCDS